MAKQSTSEKITSLLDKLTTEEAVQEFYILRTYIGVRIDNKKKELEAQTIELQSHKDKIDK